MSSHSINTTNQATPPIVNDSENDSNSFTPISVSSLLGMSSPVVVISEQKVQNNVGKTNMSSHPTNTASQASQLITNDSENYSNSIAPLDVSSLLGMSPLVAVVKVTKKKKGMKKCPHEKCKKVQRGQRAKKCWSCGGVIVIANEGMKSTNDSKYARWMASCGSKRKRAQSCGSSKKKSRKDEHTVHLLAAVDNSPYQPGAPPSSAPPSSAPPSSAPQLMRQVHTIISDQGDTVVELPSLVDFQIIPSLDNFQFESELFDFEPIDGETPFVFGDNDFMFDECFDHALEPSVRGITV